MKSIEVVQMISKHDTASLDVDAQKGFTPYCPDELPVPDGETIVSELNLQATKARLRIGGKDSHCDRAIWIADDTHPMLSAVTGRAVDVRWPKHCVPGTPGFELLPGLPHPMDYDYFVWKGIEPDMHPYGQCFHDLEEKLSTGLIEFLQSHDIQRVIVGGLATEYCVLQTVLQLRRAQFSVVVNLGACRAMTTDGEKQAIMTMQAAGVTCIPSAAML